MQEGRRGEAGAPPPAGRERASSAREALPRRHAPSLARRRTSILRRSRGTRAGRDVMRRPLRGLAVLAVWTACASASWADDKKDGPSRGAGREPPPTSAANPMTGEEADAAIDDALSIAGLSRKDLGWRARGTWDRYPQDIPYEMRHVRDVMREPLSAVPWLRAMGREARDGLSEEGLAKKGDLGAGRLYVLVHDLGVHHKYGAMRPYSANLSGAPVALETALSEVWASAGRPTTYTTFGKEPESPNLKKDLAAATAGLPKDVSEVLGKLVRDLLDAQRWADLAWRRVPMETRAAIFARQEIGLEATDA